MSVCVSYSGLLVLGNGGSLHHGGVPQDRPKGEYNHEMPKGVILVVLIIILIA